MINELIDIGANLTHKDYKNDLNKVIKDSQNLNINKLIVTGTNAEESLKAFALTKQYPKILYSTAGVHPHNAKEYSDSAESTIYELAKNSSVVAIGECGLDYYRKYSPVKDQKNAFIRQINIACDLNLPLFMHQRDAHEDFVKILVPCMSNIKAGVVHCFTGTEEMLDMYLKLDLYIGITGWICDERRGVDLQRMVSKIPLDRLLIETDCPYLLPRTLKVKPKSRRNEPKFLTEIVKVIANNTDYSLKEISDATSENAKNIFKIL